MSEKSKLFNSRQLLFKEVFIGTLIYAVVLGFFDDYTSIVDAKSFSTIFYAAVLLEVMTVLAFMLKGRIVKWLSGRSGLIYKILLVFCVWFVMFVSKFVFIWAVDLVFGNNINIYGFFGILILVLCVTIIHRLADLIFAKLGDQAL